MRERLRARRLKTYTLFVLYNAGMASSTDVKEAGVPLLPKASLWTWVRSRYTTQGLWSLFLMCALPQHVWALLIALRDVSWVTERTNAWDAVGVVGYGLMFALVESLVLFGVMAALGYLISGHWDADRRLALLSTLAVIVSLWSIAEQWFFLVGTGFPGWLIHLLIATGHPLRLVYMLVVGLVGFTVLVPAYLVLRSRRAYGIVRGLIDRLSVLMVFYLVLDALGILIVLVRNL